MNTFSIVEIAPARVTFLLGRSRQPLFVGRDHLVAATDPLLVAIREHVEIAEHRAALRVRAEEEKVRSVSDVLDLAGTARVQIQGIWQQNLRRLTSPVRTREGRILAADTVIVLGGGGCADLRRCVHATTPTDNRAHVIFVEAPAGGAS